MDADEEPRTGPMQFEGDGPGVFVRGEDAFACGVGLAMLLRDPARLTVEHRAQLERLRDVLLAVDAEEERDDLQRMGRYARALRDG